MSIPVKYTFIWNFWSFATSHFNPQTTSFVPLPCGLELWEWEMYCSVAERIRFIKISDSSLRIVGSSRTGRRFLTDPFFSRNSGGEPGFRVQASGRSAAGMHRSVCWSRVLLGYLVHIWAVLHWSHQTQQLFRSSFSSAQILLHFRALSGSSCDVSLSSSSISLLKKSCWIKSLMLSYLSSGDFIVWLLPSFIFGFCRFPRNKIFTDLNIFALSGVISTSVNSKSRLYYFAFFTWAWISVRSWLRLLLSLQSCPRP